MKRRIAWLPITLLALVSWTYPPSPLCQKVDQAWREGRESDIIRIIDTRLTESPSNPLALFLGYYYYTLLTPSYAKAIPYQRQLESRIAAIRTSITNAEDRKESEEFFTQLFPTGQVDQAITTNQEQQLREWWRKESPDEFPGSMLAQVNAKVFAQYCPDYAEELANNYELFQTEKISLIRTRGIDIFRNELLDIIRKKEATSAEIPREEWTDALKSLAPATVSYDDKAVYLNFYRFVNVRDGLFICLSTNCPEILESPGERKTNMGGGIFWYHVSL